MDNRFETSFIPQQPLLRVEGLSRRQEYINFALIASLVLFFVTVAVAGGLYIYERQIRKDISEKAIRLEGLENEIGATSIDSFKSLDGRIALAKLLLDDHKAFSVVLDFIETSVATDIALTGMNYSIEPETKNVNIEVRGQGPDYASVYRQEEHWRTMGGIVLGFEHKSVVLNETSGIVEFSVSLKLKGRQILYKDHIPPPEESNTNTASFQKMEEANTVSNENSDTLTEIPPTKTVAPMPIKNK